MIKRTRAEISMCIEYLEQGYDEDKKMKFYKVFYNAEK